MRPPAEPWEAGWKDTVIAYPGEITRIKALFDMPRLYVLHRHILSHEDNEMMVPYCVGNADGDAGTRLQRGARRHATPGQLTAHPETGRPRAALFVAGAESFLLASAPSLETI